ncbi:MAG: hypothetical protein ACOYJ2_03485 [Rickettsiales bacterium]
MAESNSEKILDNLNNVRLMATGDLVYSNVTLNPDGKHMDSFTITDKDGTSVYIGEGYVQSVEQNGVRLFGRQAHVTNTDVVTGYTNDYPADTVARFLRENPELVVALDAKEVMMPILDVNNTAVLTEVDSTPPRR